MRIDFEAVFQQLPGYWIIKDINSNYIHASNHFLALLNLNLDELIGKDDFYMPWAKTHARKYIRDDKLVFSGKMLLNYRESQMRHNDSLVNVIVNKVPIYNSDQIIGLTCSFIECDAPDHTFKLSSRQTACLTYLAQGFTAKQIARNLNLSVRTVESYTNILKTKLHCRNKAELIRKGLLLLPDQSSD